MGYHLERSKTILGREDKEWRRPIKKARKTGIGRLTTQGRQDGEDKAGKEYREYREDKEDI